VVWPPEPCAAEMPDPLESPELDEDPEEPELDEDPEEPELDDDPEEPELAADPEEPDEVPLDDAALPLATLACDDPGRT
jgi:hypothetical protein